jgi:hypothetical protein
VIVILLQFLFIGLLLSSLIYYLREYLTNSLFSSPTTYQFYQTGQKLPDSTTQGYQTPKNAVEESTFLRLLVLLLSSIAIHSVDRSLHSSPGIYLLIVGSLWSYQRRHQQKTIPNRIAFFASLAITLACLFGPFLSQLGQVAEQNRDILMPVSMAMVLVSLQLFRSSALYHRKDLSIAVLRSTLLMGVSAATNKELSFFFLGGPFLALVLPTMVLLYRSTLQLPPAKAKVLPWPELARIAAVTILFGGILALFTPHFQLSQLGIKLPAIEQIAVKVPFLSQNSLSDNSSATIDQSQSTEQAGVPLPPRPSNESAQIPQVAPTIRGGVPIVGNLSSSTPNSPSILQPAPQETAQLLDLQQDLKSLSDQVPQLSPEELSALQGRLTGLQTQLQEQPSSSAISLPSASVPILPSATAPSPIPLGQLTEQIKALQSEIHKLQTLPRPSSSQTAIANPLVQKFQQQLQATQTKVTQKISQVQNLPSPVPSKSPLTPEEEKKQQAQWITIARVAVVLMLIAGGLIWYLRQQGQQERKQQAKRRKFDQLPQVEQLYRSMLKELAKGKGFRRPPQTELEFAQLQQLRCPSPICKLIVEISTDYVAWRYGSRSINESVLAEKLQRFQAMYQLELTKKSSIPKKS